MIRRSIETTTISFFFLYYLVASNGHTQECIYISSPITLTEDTTICGGTHTVNVDDGMTAVTIGDHDITLTCEEGAVIDGVDGEGTGIRSQGHRDVTVSGCEITGFEVGIDFLDIQGEPDSNPDGAFIFNNYVHDNSRVGICLTGGIGEWAEEVRVQFNRVADNPEINIHINWCREAVISHNNLSYPTADPEKNGIGIHYDASIGGIIEYNRGGVLGIAIGAGGGGYGITIAHNVVMGSSTPDVAAIVGCGASDDIVEYNIIYDGINGMNWNQENYNITTRNNIFYNLSGLAANINYDPAICPPDQPNYFYNNIVYNSNVALGIASGGVAENNIFVGNSVGIHDEGGGVYDFNNVWNNDVDYSYLTTASPGDISADPLFASTEPGFEDFHLWFDSPCIDAGDPHLQFNDQCFPSSLGTERNDMGVYGGPWACGWECRDFDKDGYYDEACGGADCDDRNNLVNPGCREVKNNGIDDDCDGIVDELWVGGFGLYWKGRGPLVAADVELSDLLLRSSPSGSRLVNSAGFRANAD